RMLTDIWNDTTALARTAELSPMMQPAGNINTDIGETHPGRIARLTSINVAFQIAAKAHQQYLDAPPPPPPGRTSTGPLALDDLARALIGTPGATDGALHPLQTIPKQIAARVDAAGTPLPSDALT